MIEVSLKVNRSLEDEITTKLIMFGITSFEVIDDNLSDSLKISEKNWDYIDKKEKTDFVIFKVYLEDDEVQKFLEDIDIESECEISKKSIEEKDYENDWKNYFHTIDVSKDLKVVPLWEEHTESDVVINPGMAFGTGSHETTYMCLKEIDKYRPDGKILDVGTGSGILAISAAKLSGAVVDAYEIDALAIKSANQNVKLNNVEENVNIIHGDFRDYDIKIYDTIISNIYAETLCEMMPEFSKRIKSQGLIILSGIVNEKEDMVRDALQKNKFEIVSSNKQNGWSEITGRFNG